MIVLEMRVKAGAGAIVCWPKLWFTVCCMPRMHYRSVIICCGLKRRVMKIRNEQRMPSLVGIVNPNDFDGSAGMLPSVFCTWRVFGAALLSFKRKILDISCILKRWLVYSSFMSLTPCTLHLSSFFFNPSILMLYIERPKTSAGVFGYISVLKNRWLFHCPNRKTGLWAIEI